MVWRFGDHMRRSAQWGVDYLVLVDHHRVSSLDTHSDHGCLLWFHFQEDQAKCKEESVPLRFTRILCIFTIVHICCKFQRAPELRGPEARWDFFAVIKPVDLGKRMLHSFYLCTGSQDVEYIALGSVHQLVSLAILHHLQWIGSGGRGSGIYCELTSS